MKNKSRMKAIAQLLAECSEEELDRIGLVFTESEKSKDDAVDEMLLELGVPDSLSGHKYLRTAILMVAEDDSWLNGVTSILYPELAKRHNNATKSGVERSIRHAIFVACDRCDTDILNRYFGNTISPNKGAPTAKEFIGRCAGILRKQWCGK